MAVNKDKPKNDMAIFEEYFKTRSPQLRDEILEQYIPLVHFVLGRIGIRRDNQEYQDLASQGSIGLIEALDKFDISRGHKFSTYATLRIRGRVLDFLRSQDWLSRGARQNVRIVQKAHDELFASLKRSPTVKEIAQHTSLEKKKVESALADASRLIISLDSDSPSRNDQNFDLHETVSDEKQIDPLLEVENVDLQRALAEVLKELSTRDQTLLSLYYFENLTLKEIGKVLELSESRVSQIHAQIILALKVQMKELSMPPKKVNKYDETQYPNKNANKDTFGGNLLVEV